MGAPIWNRRNFLKTAAGTAGFLMAAPYVNAAEPFTDARPLKVGLVGCGGRGLGAMKNALDADPGTVVWALADVFEERTVFGARLLTEQYAPDYGRSIATLAGNLLYTQRDYLDPIPRQQIRLNPQLTQNPGW